MRRFWVFLPPATCAILVVCSPLASGRIVSPSAGAIGFVLGGALGLFLGCLYLAMHLIGKRLGWSKRLVWLSVVCFLAASITISFIVLPRSPTSHLFNDITTDPADSPIIVAGPQAQRVYDPEFARWQAEAYPQIAPAVLSLSIADAYDLCLATIRDQTDWEIIHEDAQSSTIQAVARTRLFRFEDDVIVRLRPVDGGTRIDLRSASRFGKGDRGANAARIIKFLSRIAS